MSNLSDAIHEKYETALQDKPSEEDMWAAIDEAEDDARLLLQEENP